ncbi:MAG: 50S ribosomal protein L18 [Christensenella hongkongensis]|uniref:50S ribosomal protein L18 n=1 Tax=Christensenella hongkongensis TaxID=270498 RepID=UPI002A754355|nr:50S ribosomal protein L18 [Christensenella hongkongensis]MDY3003644.1 50S ribosomal protein L18 [Christensenella hongkongensis]
MINKKDRIEIRKKRHQRIRNKISGTASRPRMNVYRSLNNIYVQFIDDVAGNTLCSASSMDSEIKEKCQQATKTDAAKMVGELAGRRASAAGISEVVFDRGGYLYTGRVAQVAQGARAAGLKF